MTSISSNTRPPTDLQRVESLLAVAYESAVYQADTGEPLDWACLGEPLTEALRMVREAVA